VLLGASTNVYGYAANNPLGLVDPTGEIVCGGLCIAAIGGAFTVGVPLLLAAVLGDDCAVQQTGQALAIAAGGIAAAGVIVAGGAAILDPIAVSVAAGVTPAAANTAVRTAEAAAFAAAGVAGPGTGASSGSAVVDAVLDAGGAVADAFLPNPN